MQANKNFDIFTMKIHLEVYSVSGYCSEYAQLSYTPLSQNKHGEQTSIANTCLLMYNVYI